MRNQEATQIRVMRLFDKRNRQRVSHKLKKRNFDIQPTILLCNLISLPPHPLLLNPVSEIIAVGRPVKPCGMDGQPLALGRDD